MVEHAGKAQQANTGHQTSNAHRQRGKIAHGKKQPHQLHGTLTMHGSNGFNATIQF